MNPIPELDDVIPAGDWHVEYLAVGGELIRPLDGTSLTLNISDGRVAGSAGINRFMGTLGPGGTFGPMETTLMAGPTEFMDQETLFLGHLSQIHSIEVDTEEVRMIADDIVVVVLGRSKTGQTAESSDK